MDRLQGIDTYWSDQARTFDDEPDHGLADPHVRAAWAGRRAEWVPPGAVRVADLDCGTGSLSILLAASGAEVVGVDLSPAMIERAERMARVAGVAVEFRVGDASRPNLRAGSVELRPRNWLQSFSRCSTGSTTTRCPRKRRSGARRSQTNGMPW